MRYLIEEKLMEKLMGYFATKPEINSVYIFGSLVENRRRKDSDVDIALFIDEKGITNPLHYRINVCADLMDSIKKKIDLIILNFANLFLRAQVFEKGKLIYERDPDLRVLFQAKSMGLYYDYKKYFNFHIKHLKNKIKERGLG